MYGFGLGVSMQIGGLTAQAVLPRADISIGTALMFFAQQLGGAIFVSVAQNIFINDLVKNLGSIPGLDPGIIAKAGATDLRSLVPLQYLTVVLAGYNKAITKTFVLSIALGATSILGALCIEWKNIKKDKKGKVGGETGLKEAENDPQASKNLESGGDDTTGMKTAQEDIQVKSPAVEEEK